MHSIPVLEYESLVEMNQNREILEKENNGTPEEPHWGIVDSGSFEKWIYSLQIRRCMGVPLGSILAASKARDFVYSPLRYRHSCRLDWILDTGFGYFFGGGGLV